ncbi:PA14 domain-containing protein [Oligoflexus tunisiensis]|uniref:PA14 domain-containing protein n=1 Tax=Oligoflexus tunisiensis TaxID=708132 RepID=UPI00114D3C02|nr:PA14 domain-containing protein [Oligoflexus tunisiensis]
MRKPLISLSLLIMALQACSGKPAGFQGDSATMSSTEVAGDATGRSFGNRDGEGDATAALPAQADAETSIETDSIEMNESIVYEGVDATIEVPAETDDTGAAPADNAPAAPADNAPTAPEDNAPAAPEDTSPPPTSNPVTPPETPAPPAAPEPLTLIVTVPSTSLRAGSAPMQATAKISGETTAANVSWTVKASDGMYPGTIDETGLYTAPTTGGGFDITITAALIDDPSVTASVTVKIVAAEQIFVGCQQGSEFFPITADVYQLPVNTSKLPDFSQIGAKLTTVCMDQYNVAPRDWSAGFPGVTGLNEWFALHTTTRLIVPSDGTYTFKLNSDDGAKIYLDGTLLIDNDGQHAPTAKEATVALAAGEHALTIDYFQGPRYQIALELYWKTPGASTYVYVPKASFK